MTLVLVTREGSVLGALPPFRVDTPFWPDVAPVIEKTGAAHQADITVLRLLEATPDPADRYRMGGQVTYLAECRRYVPASLVPWDGHLLALGLPDYSWPSLGPALADLVERHGHLVDRPARKALDRLVSELEARFAALDACGLPDTLVHGDFHPGNFRAGPDSLVLLDWGDSGVGHPLLDLPAFFDAAPEGAREAVRQLWRSRWAKAVPGSDPVRAEELIGPIADLRQALIYQRFLDGIEPSEHVYHQADVPEWLRKAAASASQGGPTRAG